MVRKKVLKKEARGVSDKDTPSFFMIESSPGASRSSQ